MEFVQMSKYRQEKTLKEQESINDNLSIANNVALTLWDIYSKDALSNYLGYWKPVENEDEEEEEEEEEESEQQED